ncbi:hypothetical protein DIU31_006140 [Mucilaginibacter rubeus]|uniref:Carboxypeptidase-like regulatory domain-containing protein n=1 Tax=Mucilaginibacter rubeus TaxID=2027860 RepID=A0AAE6JCW8_9SPHI|nr:MULTISPECIES: carboxypeptidase-like regulatory domain-containing protein [Mucilaginibacter]QEM03121.1 hypothetical protein DIU31_006140 [Mucilaginibacter rubeus]QEM15739.1 hypothetical protein DIU38_006210 [Mucilaginibacter gossypii]QTE41520.1 carboxypeptidase-like regulatory domain-containing protein [Mucilaginibacter rubeus]QTE48126.1 carboxypeptidase-like regulatory domain-containing protein [Mucilaginibacter rubeus]QTE59517.1 carboxypeptidase-like regulatory domain-containing protein [M
MICLGIERAVAQGMSGSVSHNNSPLSGAIIRNTETNKIAISDIDGKFQITAFKGDTLVTSFVGYKSDTLILQNQTSLSVYLQPATQSLTEVVIKGNRLDPLVIFRKNQQDYKQIYRIGDNSRLFNVGGGLGRVGVGISIDALYSTFSKEGKDARRLQRVLLNDYHNSVVDNRFTRSLVSKVTGYKGQQLEDFMMDNRPSYEFVQASTEYDIIAYIKRKIGGIALQSDNPSATKTEEKGFKIKFKMPNIQPNNRPTGTNFTPRIRP